MIRRGIPPEAVAGVASRIDQFFDEIWVVEDLPYAGGISQLTTVLDATSHARIGHGIAPAPFRNPVALAMEWATAARTHPGRVIAGIGHSVPTWMESIGAQVDSPLALLEESISCVIGLLAGRTVTLDGRYVHVDDISLVFPPDRRVPVVAGVRGPRSLKLSGSIADGTVLSEGTSPDGVRAARRLIDEGRSEADRTGVHDITVFAELGSGEGHLPPDSRQELEMSDPVSCAASIRRLAEAGADSVILLPSDRDARGELERLVVEFGPQLRHELDA
jgi:alkanesulfonate monooxygenase SsuD/methylene tetrahydromethanopterin reductase-like flavin-dependent oxidoreductase (luciferase family)